METATIAPTVSQYQTGCPDLSLRSRSRVHPSAITRANRTIIGLYPDFSDSAMARLWGKAVVVTY